MASRHAFACFSPSTTAACARQPLLQRRDFRADGGTQRLEADAGFCGLGLALGRVFGGLLLIAQRFGFALLLQPLFVQRVAQRAGGLGQRMQRVAEGEQRLLDGMERVALGR